MIKAPSGSVWIFIIAGCIFSSLLPPVSGRLQLLLVGINLVIWLLWWSRYRHRQTAGLVRYSHVLIGVMLPLSVSSITPKAFVDARGMMVMIETTIKKNEHQVIRGKTLNNQTVYAPLGASTISPPGQVGWLVGPCQKISHPINFWSFNQPTSLRCQGPFFAVGTAESPPWWFTLRQLYLSRLDTLSKHTRPILKALTLGDKSEISGFVADKFSHAGASHILAVSGLHVVGMSGLFYVLLIRLLSLFPLANVRWIAIISACVFAYTMVLVTEGPIGAMRAFTGMVVISLISLSGRRPNPIEILALVASLILLPTPTRWTHVGFQLSFISVWSIITFTQVNHRWLTPLSVSWWTTISTAPLLVYHFGTLSPGGILTNLILVPFVTLILMPTAWIGLCFYSFSEAPLKLASELSQFFLCVLDQLYALGSKMWILGTHNAPFVLMISMAFMLRQFPIRWRALTMLFAVIVPLIKQTDAVHFMSVGQGDATLILSHDQSAMLDAGPAFHGERLLRGLRRLGVKTLNLVSISHQHPDHFAGLEALVGRIPIKTLLTPKQPRTNQALIDLEQRLKRHGTQTIQVETQPLFVGEFTLIPYPANPALYRTENDASLAFLVHHRYGSVMVMGDLEQRGEANLLAKAPPKVDVIRAGHHGSRTSTHHSLLNRLCPKHVVLSLGHENQFGFPHKEVVRRIERHASSLWRTDIDGRITIELSPNPKIYGQHQSAQALKNIEKRQPCGQYPPNKPSLNL